MPDQNSLMVGRDESSGAPRVVELSGGRVKVTSDGDAIYSSVAPEHTVINVTIASAIVLAANADRRYVLLINDSDTPIYIGLGVAAAVNRGIRLNAGGGSYEMSAALGCLYLGAIYAIHGGAGNKVLLITEGT